MGEHTDEVLAEAGFSADEIAALRGWRGRRDERAATRAPADARLAASLLLLRDAPTASGLEVLMLRRAERDGDMRSGAVVFPGGVLDARDRDAHAHCLGPDDASASARLGLAEGGLDYLVAAVRECFEEVGLLLAQGGAGGFDLAALKPWRDRLQTGEASMADLCRAEGLRLDLRELAYFSHWLTPPGVPKRFDTRFFVAPAPAGQVAEADLGEAVELMWLTPAGGARAAARPEAAAGDAAHAAGPGALRQRRRRRWPRRARARTSR